MGERPYSRYTRSKTWAALYSQHINAGYCLVPFSATNNSISVIRCSSPEEVQKKMGVLFAHADECATYYALKQRERRETEERQQQERTLKGTLETYHPDSQALLPTRLEPPALLEKARDAVVLAKSSDYYHYHLVDIPDFKLVICSLHDSYLHLPVWETRTNKRYPARQTAFAITSPDFDRQR